MTKSRLRGRLDFRPSRPLPSRHMDGSETWTPPPEKKTHTQSYRFPYEYWYGPPGKSQSYPASIPALASHRHRSKVQNYNASSFILANDGLMLFCASRRLWRVYTFALAYLSLRHCTKISCAASDGDFCSILLLLLPSSSNKVLTPSLAYHRTGA